MSLTVGVLGGMGPRATADFFRKLIELTPARRDQDHLRVLVESNPQIPDRSAFILGGGEDPTPWLVEAARRLEAAGADFLVIPCNTAHYFLEAIRRSVRIPVLDITEAVAEAAVRAVPGLVAAGLLATTATIRARLYHRTFARREVRVVVPEGEEQEVVDRAIYSVKAGDLGPAVREGVRRVGLGLVDRGAQAIVLGCTEIPLVVDPAEWPVPVIDSTLALARTAVHAALSACREEDEPVARSQKGR
ncbi:MAG: amino acid racemase [Armatimonadota bacterium]|nr:amino acid racemase [Armatimonadota bacterium]MDR7443608.1 amino acid racemase [Armatimonadota bacterium]MDR7570183.1 amino acid racemase [Armatimonadota bacterium]MDR7613862.1 amino acid racemase [Armatimonadota bacterium]